MAKCACDMSILTRECAVPGILTCAGCGGDWYRKNGKPYVLTSDGAPKMVQYLDNGGIAALIRDPDDVVYVDPSQVVASPGKAHLSRCPDCDFAASNDRDCDCGGSGILVYHACVACGDIGTWVYGSDRAHMNCQLCGARWGAADPRWIAQRVPQRYLADASS